jgi:hypothetical protein
MLACALDEKGGEANCAPLSASTFEKLMFFLPCRPEFTIIGDHFFFIWDAMGVRHRHP